MINNNYIKQTIDLDKKFNFNSLRCANKKMEPIKIKHVKLSQ